MDYNNLRRHFRRGRKAVSPVVATLILIIVAIVGAVAVGLIVSGISSQTSKNANVASVDTDAQSVLLIGGSTTLYPAVSAGATAYSAAHGISVQVQQGGSGAGMEGVAEGVLDIGDASSYSAVATAISEYPTADLTAFETGGSGVVAISNGATATSDGFLTDGTNNCVEITQAAATEIWTDGTFYITTGACLDGTLASTDVVTVSTGAAGPYTAVSRSDLPSGTEDTFCAFIGVPPCQATSNNAQLLAGADEVGNPGVLAYVQSHPGSIGFVDLGFAEGASTGQESAQSVAIPELVINNAAVTPEGCTTTSTADAPTGATATTATAAANCFVASGQSTADLHSFVQESLSGTSGSTVFPNYVNGAGVTGLTRTFWMVTSGAPNVNEQQFITYMQSPAATSFWNNAGYFSLYQITPIAAP